MTPTELIRETPAATRRPPPASTAVAADGDAALVQRCRQGDASAWTQLVQRYQRLVYAVACRAGLDQHGAADVFQTVFARLVEHLPRIGDPSRLQAWIVTTAKRETLAVRRRGQRHVSMTAVDEDGVDGADFDIVDETPIAEAALEELQQVNRLRAAMDRLDERSRTLLTLLFRDEDERLPYDQIAARLGLPVGSIGPTRARCLEKLRKLMQDA